MYSKLTYILAQPEKINMNTTNKEMGEDRPLSEDNGQSDPYIETPWTIIESYFKCHHLDRLVRHQL